MSGQVIALRGPATPEAHEALVAAINPLHALITLDPVLGASPVRVYFVLNPVAKDAITGSLALFDRPAARAAPAFALVAYDFPFALHIVETSAPRMSREAAKAVVTRSAALQGDALQAAAEAFGIAAFQLRGFDADALKTTFFPSTQETVAHLLRLAPGKGATGAWAS